MQRKKVEVSEDSERLELKNGKLTAELEEIPGMEEILIEDEEDIDAIPPHSLTPRGPQAVSYTHLTLPTILLV